MSLKDNAYNQGADDALKDLTDELEVMMALAEENFGDGGEKMIGYHDGINDSIELARNMRQELYA